ncbi:MAG: TonB-dependent receptor domain-containing protein [Ensifer adhaerens]
MICSSENLDRFILVRPRKGRTLIVTGGNYPGQVTGTGGTYFNVDGGVRSQGIEASVDVDVTRNFSAYAAVTVTDAIYTKGFRGASYGGNKVVVPKGANVAGTPEYMVSGALNYRSEDFNAQLSVRHIGAAPGDAANTPALEIDSYTLVDLSAGYRLPLDGKRSIEARVAINNLLNERYIGGMLDDFTQRYTVGAPRSASLTLSLAF